jgi:protein SCO1/2
VKRILILPILLITFLGWSQPFTDNIGIDEKLGETITLDLKFLNEKNEVVTLRDLINKPTVIALVYLNCPGLCSPLQEGFAEVIDKTDLILGQDYQAMTISFDFHDSPQMAAQKKANFVTKIPEELAQHWHYLTTDSATVIQLLTDVGYKIKITGLDFVHPSALIVVSPEGKITRYLYGLRFLPFDLKMSVMEAQKGLPRPSINRIMEFCYSYDVEGKRYKLEVTKVVGALTLIILGLFFLTLVIRRKKK